MPSSHVIHKESIRLADSFGEQEEEDEEEEARWMVPEDSRNIFILGICVLFGWMLVILICASPHLFRNYFKKWFNSDEQNVAEKIRMAEARLEETLRLAQKPSNFLVDQATVMSSIKAGTSTTVLQRLAEEDEENAVCSA